MACSILSGGGGMVHTTWGGEGNMDTVPTEMRRSRMVLQG